MKYIPYSFHRKFQNYTSNTELFNAINAFILQVKFYLSIPLSKEILRDILLIRIKDYTMNMNL